MKCLAKLFTLTLFGLLTLSAQASTTTGSTVNVTFSVTFINPAFEVSMPTHVDFGNTLTGQRVRLDQPFAISFVSEGTPYASFHDAPFPVEFYAQNTTVGALDIETSGSMQQFFYLGCDGVSVPTKITTTPVKLDTVDSPINDLTTCRLFMDTNPEAEAGEVISRLNFTVRYP